MKPHRSIEPLAKQLSEPTTGSRSPLNTLTQSVKSDKWDVYYPLPFPQPYKYRTRMRMVKQLDRCRFHELIHIRFSTVSSFGSFSKIFRRAIIVHEEMKIHFSYGRRTKITENPQVLPILHTSAYVVRCVVSRLTNRYNCSDNYLVPYSCCKIFERESVCERERER